MNKDAHDWNPYVAGVALGLVLLTTYLVMGFGLGASAAATRVATYGAHLVAPQAVEANNYLSRYFGHGHILDDWMIFEAFGIFIGGVIGAYTAGRISPGHVAHGPRTTKMKRLALALLGGIIMGFAARLARGCTSGQALTGGAVFSVGSWIYMVAVFTGGYLFAPFVKKEWR